MGNAAMHTELGRLVGAERVLEAPAESPYNSDCSRRRGVDGPADAVVPPGNAGGPHALKYGVTGHWVMGLEAVLAPGELVELGGWLRKDVAGYDLKSVLIGSEGTLGVITSVRLGLLPAPEAAIAVVVFLRTRAQGCQAILDVLASGVRASALDFIDAQVLAAVAGGYPGTVPPDAG